VVGGALKTINTGSDFLLGPRRKYMVETTDAPTATTKKNHPLNHAQVPADRNRHRTTINKEAVVLMVRRRRSVLSGCRG